MMPQMLGQFPLPMPLVNLQTPSGLLTQALFTEEAKATLAMHEEQMQPSEAFPEINQLRQEHLAELKREVSESLAEYQARLKSEVGVFSRERLERYSLSASPLPRCPSGDSVLSLSMSDCESGESVEPELLNSDDLLKKFEQDASTAVSAGFRSLIHEQAALAQIKALQEAFDPFLIHISSSEGSDSPERESVKFELRDECDTQSVVSVRVDVDFEIDSIQVSVESGEGIKDICKCIRSDNVSWCYCRCCEKFPQLCGTNGAYSPPAPKRKGDASVRCDGEKKTSTMENLALHNEHNQNASVFGAFGSAVKNCWDQSEEPPKMGRRKY